MEATTPQPALLSLAAATALGAAVVIGLLFVASRPRRPHPGPSTMELGPEPPSVVDLLTDDFEVTVEAVPATLLDLASRGWLALEWAGRRNTVIRVPPRAGKGELTPYERRVLSHVRGLAVDGVVPADAMTTGPEAASRRWWRAFRDEVVRDAQARGLCRPRWTLATKGAMWAGILLSALLLVLSIQFGREGSDASAVVSDDARLTGIWVAVALVLAGLGWIVWRATTSAQQRETEAGLRAAGSWLGVRRFLEENGNFGELPAAAVIIWERYLALAVAMDLAPVAASELPLGAEDDHHAWSRASGRWRRVRVRYPRLRPAWGAPPWAAVVSGILVGAAAGFGAYFSLRVGSGLQSFVEEVGGGSGAWIGRAALAAAGALMALAAWQAVKVVLGLADASARQEVEGVLLRSRALTSWGWLPSSVERAWFQFGNRSRSEREPAFFVAVDTGESPEISAWRVRKDLYGRVHQGDLVRAAVTPRLGHVRSMKVLSPALGRGVASLGDAAERAVSAAGLHGGLLERIGAAFDRLADVRDEDGRPILDRSGADGVTLRERLDRARRGVS